MEGIAQSGFQIPQRAPGTRIRTDAGAVLEGPHVLRVVYWIFAALSGGVAFYFGGIEAATIAIAALIGLWAFVEPRTSFWLATAFMVCLFVFFQQTAPLGEEVPAEFLYWGAGIALITLGLVAAAPFSSQVDWTVVKKRIAQPCGLAMFGMTAVIAASTVYGLFAGNRLFVVARQLFGCMLLPAYFFLALVLFRSHVDVARWLLRARWFVTLGALWYDVKLFRASEASASYYREQSPLVMYAGAVALIAFCEILAHRRIAPRLAALFQLSACLFAILLMGSRSSMGSFLAGAAAAVFLLVWNRRVLIFALVAAAVPVGMGVYPYVASRLLAASGLSGDVAARFIFVLDRDQSYLGRVAQTDVVLNTVERKPVLGSGMGSENSFFMPGVGRIKVASVDNGWGYVLLKMGYLGLATFLLLVAALLYRGLSGLGHLRPGLCRANRVAVVAVFLYAVVSFIGGPTFLHFSTAAFFATLLGALVVMAEASDAIASAPTRSCST